MATQQELPLLDFPLDPLESVTKHADSDYRRRTIGGILESYHGNYDILAEALQNAVDAVEDAKLGGSNGPFEIVVTIDLDQNTIAVLDTGIGMTKQEVARALAPNVSFKGSTDVAARKRKAPYRGYKGVGLIFFGLRNG